jgi:hypothetical protein
VNELSSLFRDKTDTAGSDVSLETLAQYWKQTKQENKKFILDKLKMKASEIPRDNVFSYKSMGSNIQ